LHRQAAAAVLLLAGLLIAAPALAETRGAAPKDPETVEQVRKWNAECLDCHTEAALRRPPRPDMDLTKLAKVLTDPARYEQSGHAGMACRTCHTGRFRVYPHQPAANPAASRPETLECAECHAQKTNRIEDQVARSVHAKNLKDRFTCSTCHDPHVYTTAAKLVEPPKIVSQDNAMCLDCHNSSEKFAKFGGTLTPAKARPDIDVIHAFLPNAKRHWQAVRCIECHTPAATTKSLAMSHEILNKDKAEKNCVTCHSFDSALRTRLYRHMAETDAAKLGFLNSAILRDSYVIGATRNPILDLAALVLLGLTFAGVAVHAGLRILSALGRGRNK
jgi:predicted CXXCH cytochrome family protein